MYEIQRVAKVLLSTLIINAYYLVALQIGRVVGRSENLGRWWVGSQIVIQCPLEGECFFIQILLKKSGRGKLSPCPQFRRSCRQGSLSIFFSFFQVVPRVFFLSTLQSSLSARCSKLSLGVCEQELLCSLFFLPKGPSINYVGIQGKRKNSWKREHQRSKTM